MLTPLPSALAYWLFGVGSPRAEYLLSAWTVFLVCLSIWLCWRLAVALDAPRGGRIIAVAVASLAPLFIAIEVRFGRNYEHVPATVILIWILLRMVQADAGALSRGWLVLIGAAAGFLFSS
jgi:4-amino-4-deoxy-L-arabinose transferase-like glycosyltransferase